MHQINVLIGVAIILRIRPWSLNAGERSVYIQHGKNEFNVELVGLVNDD
ncbi:hypothetical protein BCU66_022290 [Vibrio sp. 10N.286.49.B1]|nr:MULTISPECIES: hypothetical protein [unclassified Vibrio]